MKSKPSTPEYKVFSDALRSVLQVPHSDLKQKLDEEKKAKAETPERKRKKSRKPTDN